MNRSALLGALLLAAGTGLAIAGGDGVSSAPPAGGGGDGGSGDAPIADRFLGAAHFTPANRPLSSIRWIVLHSTENTIGPGVAWGVAQFFHAQGSGVASSAHYVVGPDEIVQCVDLRDIAWAAPGANVAGVQIEQVGRAASTDWTSGDGLEVMRRSARLAGELARYLGIPLVALGPEDLLAGRPGLVTHWAVAEACRRARARDLRVAPWFVGGRWEHSDHADPGLADDRRWPWSQFLTLAKEGIA